MGVTVREKKQSAPTLTMAGLSAPASTGSGDLATLSHSALGRSARTGLVIASALASILSTVVVVAILVAGLQTRPQAQSPTTTAPAYAPRPVAIVNGHVWLQGKSGWKDVTPGQPSQIGADDPVDAQFISATLGWAVDVQVSGTTTRSVVVSRTTDGGATWTSVTLPWQDEGLANLVQLQFVNATHGFFIVGLRETTSRRPGFLFSTTDGGATWTKLSVPYGGAIRFSSANDGWLVGGGVNYARNAFSVTHDGGHTWQEQPLIPPPGFELADRQISTPAFSTTHSGTSDLDGVVAANFGGEIAFYTYEADGSLWLLRSTFPVARGDRTTLPVIALSGRDGMASVGAALYATHDGGKTWAPVQHDANLTNIQWLGVTGPTTGWAVVSGRGFCAAQLLTRCDNESLLTTADGGASWR